MQAVTPMKTDVISENQTSDDSDDCDTETGNDESNILNYIDRRERKRRGRCYHDILAAL